MKILRFTYWKTFANLNFSVNSSFSGCVSFIISFILSVNFFYSQELITAETGSQIPITVNIGTTIISSDPSFNKQVSEKTIITDGIVNSFKDDDKSQIIVIRDIKQKLKRKALQSFAFDAQKDKGRLLPKVIKTIETTIIEYKKLVLNNLADNIRNNTTNKFFNVKNSASSFALPPANQHHNASKIFIFSDHSLRLSINSIKRFQYFYYNNKSISYCFSKVFSVRPPPVLV